MIDSYSFGKMKVNGKTYAKDLIIFPDHVFSPWWRDSGHRLHVGDLQDVFDAKPEVLVVGTGSIGRMKVDDTVRQKCRDSGIRLIVKKSKAAAEEFNTQQSSQKTIGAFHLTC